ncbi:hypothetical protein MTQ24_09485 [Corynebacterium bovis]|uniref:hypothetical protein n=1 Tax=Corynebacterium bovis TaxID=36808 RepID=UPI003138B3EC
MQIERGVLLPVAAAADQALRHEQRSRHPAGHIRGPGAGPRDTPLLDAVTRARAHHLARPHHVAAAWSALALFCLPFWVDEQPTTFLATSSFRRRDLRLIGTASATVPPDPRAHGLLAPDPCFPGLLAEPPGRALGRAVADVLAGRATWWTCTVPGLSPGVVRAVQLVDSVLGLLTDLPARAAEPRHLGGLSGPAVRAALPDAATTVSWLLSGVVGGRLVGRLAGLADDGTDSPPETLLRLLARSVDHRYRTQIPVIADGVTVTTADGGWSASPQVVLGGCRPDGVPAPGGGRTRGYDGPLPGHGWSSGRGGIGVDAAPPPFLLFYDGSHHLLRGQRDHDSAVTALLEDSGVGVLRVTAGMLRDPESLRGRIAERLVSRGWTLDRGRRR